MNFPCLSHLSSRRSSCCTPNSHCHVRLSLFCFVLNGDGEQLVHVIFMTIFIYLNSVDKLSLFFSFIPAFLTLLERFCFSFQKSFLLLFSGLGEFRPQTGQKNQVSPEFLASVCNDITSCLFCVCV